MLHSSLNVTIISTEPKSIGCKHSESSFDDRARTGN